MGIRIEKIWHFTCNECGKNRKDNSVGYLERNGWTSTVRKGDLNYLQCDQCQLGNELAIAIQRGPARAIDGLVFIEDEKKSLMTISEMLIAVKNLKKRKIEVNRIDSGGEPTWDVVPSVEHMELIEHHELLQRERTNHS